MGACELRFLDFNYLFQDNVTVTGSSEQPNFPVSNLKLFFRSQVWRSNGTFIIDATNNKIDFKESGGGGELTATLTSGTFDTITLAAEIKTQLESAGAEIYTVSFSKTTGQWTISTGGTFLSILTNSGTNTAVSTGPSIGFGTTSDFTGNTTYTGFVAIHTEENINIDLGSAEEIDSFCMFFDPRAGIKLSGDAVIKLQANATPNFSSPSLDITLSIDDFQKTISHFFTTDQSFRFWRINIVDSKNNNLFVEFGAITLAKSVVLERLVAKGFKYKKRDTSRRQANEFGNVYFDKRPFIQSLEFNFKVMTNADSISFEKIYDNVGVSTPLVVAFDPLEQKFDKDRFLIFGHFTRQLEFSHVFKTFFNNGFRIEESF